MRKRTTVILAVLMSALLLASTALALLPSSNISRTFTNNTGVTRTDLHIWFNGPVDANTGVTGFNPPFADITNAGTNVIQLSNGSVANGASTGCIRFSSSADGLAIDSAYWTPGNVPLNLVTDVSACAVEGPALTEYGLLALVLLIVISAAWVIRRQRLTAAS